MLIERLKKFIEEGLSDAKLESYPPESDMPLTVTKAVPTLIEVYVFACRYLGIGEVFLQTKNMLETVKSYVFKSFADRNKQAMLDQAQRNVEKEEDLGSEVSEEDMDGVDDDDDEEKMTEVDKAKHELEKREEKAQKENKIKAD